VGGISWTQPGALFPIVRHSIVIGVPISRAMDFGIILPAADVILRIGQTGQAGPAAFEFGGAGADFSDDALVVLVERREIAADVGEDVGIGLMGGMSLCVRLEERRGDPRRIVRG